VAMNVAHDLDREDNDTIVARGKDWIISSNISTGSAESMVQVFVTQCGWGQGAVMTIVSH
jgi:hypothetical protein